MSNFDLIGRKVRGVVICRSCELPEELAMAGYFFIAGPGNDDLSCERCGQRLGGDS